MTDAERSPLVRPEVLAAELAGERPPVLLDVRWSLTGPPARELYALGHLPGAVHVDLDTVLAAAPGGGGRHPLPDRAALVAGLAAAGVSDDRPVVAYDAGASGAARAWWLLRDLGHRDVRVLDGGVAGWQAAGLPLTTAVPDVVPGTLTDRGPAMPVLDAAAAAELARTGLLVDARAGERYAGRTEPVDPVAGHIPGARSLPTAAVVTPEGAFRPADEVAQALASARAGLSADVPVGAYCGSGVSATQVVLALEVLGAPAALYPGSWSEWITDPARPVATGDLPG